MTWKKISWRWFINNVNEPNHKKWNKLKIVEENNSAIATIAVTSDLNLPTKKEVWEHLKSLPTPPVEILLKGTTKHYVEAAHDFMCSAASRQKE